MKKLLFILPLLLLPLITVNPASAASVTPLCSFTFDSSNVVNGSTQYCDNFLSSIKYIEIDFGVDSDTNSMAISYNTRSYNNQSGRSYYLVGVTSLPYSWIQSGSGYSDTYPLTVSFYDQFPGGSCPEPEPCPDCEDCEHPPFIDMVISAFWQYHTAFAGAIAGILAIFFIFRFIKARLR